MKFFYRNYVDCLSNLIHLSSSEEDKTGGTGTREFIIYHNKKVIPKIIGITLEQTVNNTEIENSYQAGYVKVIEITNSYFKIAYTRISHDGSYRIKIAYTF